MGAHLYEAVAYPALEGSKRDLDLEIGSGCLVGVDEGFVHVEDYCFAAWIV